MRVFFFFLLIACVGWGASPRIIAKILQALFQVNLQIVKELLPINSCSKMKFQLQTGQVFIFNQTKPNENPLICQSWFYLYVQNTLEYNSKHFDLNKYYSKMIWIIKFLLKLTWLVFFIVILFKVLVYIKRHSISKQYH